MPRARLADVFVDAPYHRSNFLLVSASPDKALHRSDTCRR